MAAKFGPSGNSELFYAQGYKSSLQMPGWLEAMGLEAYEYQCSKGVNISQKTAENLGAKAQTHHIQLSIHAPYYISLASEDEQKRANSIQYILETLQAAQWMGATRIVVHPGACGKMQRSLAMKLAKQTLKQAIIEADQANLGHIAICPETMGKTNQLGTLDEILEMCLLDERIIPTIDFGHIHARGQGCLNSIDDFAAVLKQIEDTLGFERLSNMHCHYSRIEFTNGGEKKHWRWCDSQYGPEFEPLAVLIADLGLSPVIICEARGTMAEDALILQQLYRKAAGEKL